MSLLQRLEKGKSIIHEENGVIEPRNLKQVPVADQWREFKSNLHQDVI